MSNLINKDDSLNKGREKLNAAIEKVDTFQDQINTIVVEGDSSVEAAQARIDAENNTFATLKERLDTKETQFSAQLAQITKEFEQVGTTDITRKNGLATQITTPTSTINLIRNDEGVVQSVEEFKIDKNIKTTLVRDSEGVIKQIEREMI